LQVNWGLATELSNAGPGRDRMVVVLDARGASSLALTRHMALLKHLAVVLNQHYPVRSGLGSTWDEQMGSLNATFPSQYAVAELDNCCSAVPLDAKGV